MLQIEKIHQRVKSPSLASRILLEVGRARGQRISNLFIPQRTRRSFLNNLSHLARQGFITIKKESERISVSLTEAGRLEFFKLSLNQSKKLPDGVICLVVFDIPEKYRNHRWLLRKFLLEKAFVPLQKSVWISQFDDAEILLALFRHMKIGGWVRVYKAREKNCAF
jgi:DNA-binding transcriptional regulator PaaX